jgi:hypothetical protein
MTFLDHCKQTALAKYYLERSVYASPGEAQQWRNEFAFRRAERSVPQVARLRSLLHLHGNNPQLEKVFRALVQR